MRSAVIGLILALPLISPSQVNLKDIFSTNSSRSIDIEDMVIINESGSYYDSIQEETFPFIPVNLLLNDKIKDSLGRPTISGNYAFRNCVFEETLILTDLNFTGRLKFESCLFKNGFLIRNTQLSELYSESNNSEIAYYENLDTEKLILRSDTVDDLSISESVIRTNLEVEIHSIPETFDFIANEIHSPKAKVFIEHEELFNSGYPTDAMNVYVNAKRIAVEDNNFMGASKFSIFNLEAPHAEFLVLTNNTCLGTFILGGSTDFFRTFRNQFEKIDFKSFSFPEFETSIQWEDIAGFSLANVWSRGEYDDYGFPENQKDDYISQMNIESEDFVNVDQYYFGVSDHELQAKWFYDHLISDYYRIYQTYKVRGRLEDANAVYVELNDLYGNRMRAMYKKEGSLSYFLKWKLNQLLKFYTVHGTDPIRALIISFYLILAFGIFYFLFPSEWDDLEWKKDNLKNLGAWKLTKLIVTHLFNSLVLSLNAFVTLGFGNIPTKGTPRYVCVIQGFMGWFLLSLFTVALINQTLF